MALTPRLLEPFSGPASALFDDPDTVIARKRRSPNELGGPVGAVPQDIRPERRTDRSAARRRSGSGALMDGLKPAAAPRSHAAPQPDAEPDPAPKRRNDIEDLSRIGRALGDAGEPEDAASVTTPARAADALTRFQRRRGLRVDGWAAPGGETDRALDNIARRRKRLAAQNRPEASETLDDRLAVFVETREERDRLARDDVAALLSTVTGRIFARDHAGTTDPEAARPALLQALARLRAERQAPPDDGSRPPLDDEPAAEDPPEEEDPPTDETGCVSLQYIKNLEAQTPGKQALIDQAQARVDDLKRQISEAERDMAAALASAGKLGLDARNCLALGKPAAVALCLGVLGVSVPVQYFEALTRRNAAKEQLGPSDETLERHKREYEALVERIDRLKAERAECLRRKHPPTS